MSDETRTKKSFRLRDSLLVSLEVLAGKRNISLSRMVEEALSTYLSDDDEKVGQMSDMAEGGAGNEDLVEFMREQIKTKDAEIERLHRALDQAHAIALSAEALQLQSGKAEEEDRTVIEVKDSVPEDTDTHPVEEEPAVETDEKAIPEDNKKEGIIARILSFLGWK